MQIKLVESYYSWSEMSIWDFLLEGNIPSGWKNFFIEYQYIVYTISKVLESEKKNKLIYPPINYVFRAFIPIKKIKVVVLGQDPYHSGTDEFNCSAVGYCFSVANCGNKINPSLRNIYKELKRDGYNIKEDGNLSHWVDQGCFMLNTSLTVNKGEPESHIKIWNNFTVNVIKYLADNTDGIIWLLMGSKAHKFKEYIGTNHIIFLTSHPSPFSYMRSSGDIPSFYGSNVFSNINNQLKNKIMW